VGNAYAAYFAYLLWQTDRRMEECQRCDSSVATRTLRPDSGGQSSSARLEVAAWESRLASSWIGKWPTARELECRCKLQAVTYSSHMRPAARLAHKGKRALFASSNAGQQAPALYQLPGQVGHTRAYTDASGVCEPKLNGYS